MRLLKTENTKKKSNKGAKLVLLTEVKRRFFKGLLIVCSLIVLCLCLTPVDVLGVFYDTSKKRLPIYGVKTDEKKLAISFDCAWGVDYTDNLLDIMDEAGIKATFFMVEFWAEKYPDYVKKIYDRGFEIGTHSSTHPYMSKLTESQMEQEFMTSKAAIQKITGSKVKLFRPPFGDYSDKVIEVAERLGLTTIQWSVDSLDWKDLSAEEIYQRVTSKVQSGSIVLFHNQGLHTAEALKNIIDCLVGKGYEFVTIGELIYKEGYFIDSNGIQIKSN